MNLRFVIFVTLVAFIFLPVTASFAQNEGDVSQEAKQEETAPEIQQEVPATAQETPSAEAASQESVQSSATQSVEQNTETTLQEAPAGDPLIREMQDRIDLYGPDVMMQQMGSLFFTSFEHNSIDEARNGLFTRPVTETEVKESIQVQEQGIRPPMGPRELEVGGIVYVSSDEWTVWLNKQKITPDRLPPEILDIRVYKDYIKIKWFDAYTNQIFPVKIRTHQRFNIDTRIFLPGQ